MSNGKSERLLTRAGSTAIANEQEHGYICHDSIIRVSDFKLRVQTTARGQVTIRDMTSADLPLREDREALEHLHVRLVKYRGDLEKQRRKETKFAGSMTDPQTLHRVLSAPVPTKSLKANEMGNPSSSQLRARRASTMPLERTELVSPLPVPLYLTGLHRCPDEPPRPSYSLEK